MLIGVRTQGALVCCRTVFMVLANCSCLHLLSCFSFTTMHRWLQRHKTILDGCRSRTNIVLWIPLKAVLKRVVEIPRATTLLVEDKVEPRIAQPGVSLKGVAT